MQLTKSLTQYRTWQRTDEPEQVLLQKGEILRLNPAIRCIGVVHGTAWITWKRDDILLSDGQELQITANSSDVVISALSCSTLSLALYRSPP